MTDRPSRSSEFGREVANVGRGRERGIVGRNEAHRKNARDQQERELVPLVKPAQAGEHAGASMPGFEQHEDPSAGLGAQQTGERQSHDLPGVGNRPASRPMSQSGARISDFEDAPAARPSTH